MHFPAINPELWRSANLAVQDIQQFLHKLLQTMRSGGKRESLGNIIVIIMRDEQLYCNKGYDIDNFHMFPKD